MRGYAAEACGGMRNLRTQALLRVRPMLRPCDADDGMSGVAAGNAGRRAARARAMGPRDAWPWLDGPRARGRPGGGGLTGSFL